MQKNRQDLHPVALDIANKLKLEGGVARLPNEQIAPAIMAIRHERDRELVCAHVLVLAQRFQAKSPGTANHLFALVVLAIGLKEGAALIEKATGKSATQQALAAARQMSTAAFMDAPKKSAPGLSMRAKR